MYGAGSIEKYGGNGSVSLIIQEFFSDIKPLKALCPDITKTCPNINYKVLV